MPHSWSTCQLQNQTFISSMSPRSYPSLKSQETKIQEKVVFNRDTGFASLKMIFLRGHPPSQETRTAVYFNFRIIIPCLPQRECLTCGRLALTEYLGAQPWGAGGGGGLFSILPPTRTFSSEEHWITRKPFSFLSDIALQGK